MNIIEGRETGTKRRLRPGYAGMVSSLLVALAFLGWSADEALSASITIAGNGPELRMVERLTSAFEKKYFGAVDTATSTAASFVEFAVSREAKDIIEEMYVSYTPENEPHTEHSPMREM